MQCKTEWQFLQSLMLHAVKPLGPSVPTSPYTRTASICGISEMHVCAGPKEGALDLLWHPLRSCLASVSSVGKVHPVCAHAKFVVAEVGKRACH